MYTYKGQGSVPEGMDRPIMKIKGRDNAGGCNAEGILNRMMTEGGIMEGSDNRERNNENINY